MKIERLTLIIGLFMASPFVNAMDEKIPVNVLKDRQYLQELEQQWAEWRGNVEPMVQSCRELIESTPSQVSDSEIERFMTETNFLRASVDSIRMDRFRAILIKAKNRNRLAACLDRGIRESQYMDSILLVRLIVEQCGIRFVSGNLLNYF